jgi:AraC family transcriptional regulator, transcriptional activator of pobA
MDGRRDRMDNPRIAEPEAAVGDIPVYTLYGEREQPFLPERLHSESIPERSRLYDWEIGLHRHDLFVQILEVRAGSGQARLDGQGICLRPPSALWIPARHEHGFRFSRDIEGDVITVLEQHAEALLGDAALWARLQRPQCLALGAEGRGGALAAAIAALLAEVHGREAGRLAAIESTLRLTLLRLARLAMPPAGRPAGERRAATHVQRLTALIDRHFRTPQPLAFYARELGLSVPQLNRICRRHLGGSALRVIQRRVLHEAERDLAYSSLAVKEIALTLGFTDAGYFSRFFSRHAGCSPTEFRAGAWRRLGPRYPRGR